MIKRISFLTRKDGTTHEEFVRHWSEIHGPLARGIPGLCRYVQSHIVGEASRADIAGSDIAIDGIAELWYDNAETMEQAIQSDQAKRLFADGAEFIGAIKTFVVEEKVIIDG